MAKDVMILEEMGRGSDISFIFFLLFIFKILKSL